MKKYNEYKDSGIQWLGEIPEHWEVSHIKRICKKITDGAHTSPDLSSPDYPFLSVVNLKHGKLDFVKCHYTSTDDYNYLLRNGCRPFKNDVLFSKDGTIGESIVITENIEFVVGSSFIITRPNKIIISSYYFQYFLSSPLIKATARVFVKGTGIPRLSIFNFSRLNTLIPPLKEQTQIANYLDAKTTAIDKKVSLLQQKIKHYKAYRKTLINETVTKGLDKTVKLKDSGIDWIGEIPEHWEVKRIKDIFNTLAGGTPSTKEKSFWIGEIPWIPSGAVQNGEVNSSVIKSYISEEALLKTSTKMARKDSILIALTGATCSNIGYLNFDTTINQSIVSIDSNQKYTSHRYYFYFLISAKEKIRTLMTGGAQGGINQGDVKYFKVCFTSKKEQQLIADYLDAKTATIDKIVKNIETQITTLKELRKTLINEVVTGKVKVSA
jgi:type I restriction enzyme S subunit